MNVRARNLRAAYFFDFIILRQITWSEKLLRFLTTIHTKECWFRNDALALGASVSFTSWTIRIRVPDFWRRKTVTSHERYNKNWLPHLAQPSTRNENGPFGIVHVSLCRRCRHWSVINIQLKSYYKIIIDFPHVFRTPNIFAYKLIYQLITATVWLRRTLFVSNEPTCSTNCSYFDFIYLFRMRETRISSHRGRCLAQICSHRFFSRLFCYFRLPVGSIRVFKTIYTMDMRRDMRLDVQQSHLFDYFVLSPLHNRMRKRLAVISWQFKLIS